MINKDDSPSNNKESVVQNQDAFLKAMELDAEERYKRKQENLRLSNELKEKGNVEYQNKNYEKAIEFYSEVFDYMILLTFKLKEFFQHSDFINHLRRFKKPKTI